MKNLILLLLALALLTGIAFAADKPAQPQAKTAAKSGDVLQTLSAEEKRLWDAWKNKDTAVLQKLVSDDAVAVSVAGAQSKAEFIKEVGGGGCDVKSYDLKDLKTTTFAPGTVLLTYKAEQQATCGGQALPPAVYGSSLYLKRGGNWLVVFHQETPAM